MSEYDGLIKRLQNAAMWADKGLVIPPSLVLQAVDAIEELQGQLSVCLEGTKVRFLKNDDGTEEIRFENQWIPVTERLPAESKHYLAVINGTVGEAAFYAPTGQWFDPVEEWENWSRSVTHWMPLPQQPKEETE